MPCLMKNSPRFMKSLSNTSAKGRVNKLTKRTQARKVEIIDTGLIWTSTTMSSRSTVEWSRQGQGILSMPKTISGHGT